MGNGAAVSIKSRRLAVAERGVNLAGGETPHLGYSAGERMLASFHPDTGPLQPTTSLIDYEAAAWKHVDPARFVDSWHLHAIADVLEAVAAGEIRDLVINIPPRHTKSISVSIMFPSWLWTFRPELKLLFASYAAKLSLRDSLSTRRLIRTLWYQGQWSDSFQVLGDKDTVVKFENDRGGYRMATSVGGIATGEGGDFIIIDDAVSADDAESETVREAANTWYSETMTTRRNDLRTGVRIIVMQRLHERDLTGHVLQDGDWEMLCLPEEYDPGRVQLISTPKVAEIAPDPRTQEGELLCPERIGPEELEKLKKDLTPYAYAGQFQQLPAPRGGGDFHRDWFEIVPSAPYLASRLRYWDKAATAGGRGAFTAGVKWARDLITGVFYIEDVVRGRWATEEREAIIKQLAESDGRGCTIWTEQEPGSGGKDSALATIRGLAGWTVFADRADKDKTTRAGPLITQSAARNVKLVAGDWNEAFLREAESWPAGRWRDQIDAAAGGFNRLMDLRPYSVATAGTRKVAVVR